MPKVKIKWLQFQETIGGPLIGLGAEFSYKGERHRNVVQFQMPPNNSHLTEARDELERWAQAKLDYLIQQRKGKIIQ